MLRKDAFTFLLVICWGIYIIFVLPMVEIDNAILIRKFTIGTLILAGCLLTMVIGSLVSNKFWNWLNKKF